MGDCATSRSLPDTTSPPYCAGEATRWGGDILTPFQANVPVVLSGVGILPGQFVYADSSGAAVIPEAEVREVLEEAAQITVDDASFIEDIQQEDAGTVSIQGSDER